MGDDAQWERRPRGVKTVAIAGPSVLAEDRGWFHQPRGESIQWNPRDRTQHSGQLQGEYEPQDVQPHRVPTIFALQLKN
jgi:hypothetical protein